MTVHVLVDERVHPVPVSAPTTPVTVGLPVQLSEVIGVPNAEFICAEVGLQPRADGAASVIAGFCVSLV